MTIDEIYKKINIPPNLVEHMLDVAAVVMFIKDNWKGEELDWELLEKAALLHDLGNVVKFDLDNHADLLGKEVVNLDYWKQTQKEIIEAYGADDHEATKKMLSEICIEKAIIEIIAEKSFGNSLAIFLNDNWYLKILHYADLRILPDGIGSLNDRFEDVKKRMSKYTKRQDFAKLLEACEKIEIQVQANLNVPVSYMTRESVEKCKKGLLEMAIGKSNMINKE